MPTFPTAAATPVPAFVVTRTIGGVNINDHINSWSNHPDEAGITRNVYEQRVLASGQIIRTRQDTIAEIVTVNGHWFDGGGNRYVFFRDSLLNLNQVPCDLGHGVKYAMCDVIDVSGTYQGVTSRNATTNEVEEAWLFSLKLQCYSGVRTP